MKLVKDLHTHIHYAECLEGIRVLLYHHIDHTDNRASTSTMSVQVNVFRKQLELLEQWGYSTITFEDVRLYLAGELNLPNKSVIITFDDGYEDVYEHAFPILREFGMKAVIFVIGDPSIKENIWDKDSGDLSPLLGQQQILEMSASGFEIGAHSMTHAKLTLIQEREATEEILRARMMLEILLNVPVSSFAYPFGLVNDTVKRIARDAGYTVGCAAYSGPAMFGQDLFEIRRILVPNSANKLRFWWQLQSVSLFAYWLNWRIKNVFSSFKKPTPTNVTGNG